LTQVGSSFRTRAKLSGFENRTDTFNARLLDRIARPLRLPMERLFNLHRRE
jgi:hypothetical protein